MSQDSYEYECMRAELLGLPKPEKRPEPVKQIVDDEDDDDEVDVEATKEIHDTKENLGRVGGGLEELNSILTVTQKKINNFKSNFGSLKDIFRQHISFDNGSGGESKSTDSVKDGVESSSEGTPDMNKRIAGTSKAVNDLGQEMESQVDKLDILVTKAEYAEMSMAEQNKQMRKFLN